MMIHSAGGGGFQMWRLMGSDDKAQANVNRDLLRRVGGYARPYIGQIAFILTVITITALIELVPPLIMRQLIDVALPTGDLVQLNWLALGMVAIPVITGLLGVAQRYQSAKVGEGLIFDLRNSLYTHMQKMSLRFFTNTKTGEIMARLNSDVVGAQRAITGTLVSIIINIITLISTLTIMITLEWRLTLVGILILPLFILPAKRVGSLLRDVSRDSMDLNAKMNALMNETLNVSGAMLMKIFGREPENRGQFRQRSAAVRDIGVRSAVIGRWFFMGLSLVSAIGTAMVFWFGGWLVLQDVFTVGTIIAFTAYLARLYGPISALANSRVEFMTSMVSFERVFEVIDLPIEIDEKPDAVALADVRGEITFDNVSFSYMAGENPEAMPFSSNSAEVKQAAARHKQNGSPQQKMVMSGQHPPQGGAGGIVRLASQTRRWHNDDTPDYVQVSARRWATHNVSFNIQPGQLAALVGPSGAGKTTITYLLPRLYDPTEGQITIDGHDLRGVTLGSLAAQVGMVTQETYLFHDTLRANLQYAKPGATDEELIAACKVANIYDFVQSLPEGFDTIVGERGYRLSGGEKQRVAIARVILKDPRILILDEATSSLDSQSEALIQAALKPLFTNRTSLVIAHRLSTILAADVILVMDEGRLVEQGTHAELLAQGGLYADLYNTQFRKHHLPEEMGEIETQAG